MEEFLWEFHNCPFGESVYVIAEDGGEVIGTNCVIPINLIDANGKVYRTGKSEDTLVDPAYRGQKIFYHIYDFLFQKCLENGIQVIWGFTSAIGPFKKIGFDIPYHHEQSLAVSSVFKTYHYLSSLNTKNKLADKAKIFGLCLLSKFRSSFKGSGGKSQFDIRHEIVRDIDVYEHLLKDQLVKHSLYAIHQTKEYQNWRIYDNPNYYKVHCFNVYDGTVILAQVIFNSHENKVAFNCQSIFNQSINLKDQVNILKTVTRLLFDEGIVAVRNWHFNTNELNRQDTAMYKSAGYTVLNRGIGLVWKTMDDTDLSPNQFYLSRIATQGAI